MATKKKVTSSAPGATTTSTTSTTTEKERKPTATRVQLDAHAAASRRSVSEPATLGDVLHYIDVAANPDEHAPSPAEEEK